MTSDISSHAATVSAIYQAFGRGDVPFILGRLNEEVSWDADWADHSAHRNGVAHLAPRRGRQGVAEFFGVIGAWQVEDFQVLDLIGSGRQVAAEMRAAFVLPGGRRLADEEMHLWTFDDSGQVVRFRHYVDTAKHMAVAAEAQG